MSGPSTFFVKSGYICNEEARSYEASNTGEYWTPARIEAAFRYQHHVYRLAAEIARENGFKVGLDLGCGPATKASTILAPVLSRIYLIDQPSCESLATASVPGAAFYPADLEVCDISIDSPMDLIVCADVLEHLVDPTRCLGFARRYLGPSGLAVFSTPERDVLRGVDCTRSMHPAHVREWNRQEFRQLLEHSGFKVIRHEFVPAQRLVPLEELLRKLNGGMIKLRRWRACQVAICRS